MKDQAMLYPPGANDECHTPDYAVRALIPHLAPGLTCSNLAKPNGGASHGG